MATTNDESARTTPAGLARYAYEYVDAARLVADRAAERHPHNDIPPMPAYFLAMHGIELSLKAFLLLRSVPLEDLGSRKFGHDLTACYTESKNRGLGNYFREHDRDQAAFEMLIGLNEYQGTRYIRTGMKHFPLWSLVEPLAVRLHQAVAPLVGYETFAHSYAEYERT